MGEFILENYYSEFVNILNVPSILAGQTASVTNLWDADDPPVLASEFTALDWTKIDISPGAAPGLSSGILISARPVGESLPSVKLAVRSSIDELLVDSFMSRHKPFPLRLEGDTHIEEMVVEGDRPINILASGHQYLR